MSNKASKFKTESTLQRTKSTGVESVQKLLSSGLVQGTLSGWISKLNSDDAKNVPPKVINIKLSPTGKTHNETLQSQDPFSEDEEILELLSQNKSLLENKSLNLDSSPFRSQQLIKSEKLNSLPEADVSEDPFSDETDPRLLIF